jgi:hypothetical protein
MDPVAIQVALGYVMSFAIETLKQAAWFPWLTEQSARIVKMVVAWVVAAASACAVTFTYDPTLGNLLVTGLSWANVKGGLTTFVVSLAAQTFSYKIAVKAA